MPEIGLERPRVMPLIRKGKAASVPEHVRVRLEPKLCLYARALHHAGKASGAEGCSSLTGEHERGGGVLLAL